MKLATVCRKCQKGGSKVGYDGSKKVLGTKIHACVDRNSLPLSMVLGSANEHDSTRFVDIIQQIRIQNGARPRTRPDAVYADKAYDFSAIRKYLALRKSLGYHGESGKKRTTRRLARYMQRLGPLLRDSLHGSVGFAEYQ